MSRAITARYAITGALEALDPIHVGGAAEDLAVDMPLARDGAGRHVLPGTSLAGPLRALCDRRRDLVSANVFAALWGETASKAQEGAASLIMIDDAPVDGDPQETLRDGVGIDPVTGAAADKVKYDRAILPPGARFPFRLVLDLPFEAAADTAHLPTEDEVQACLGVMLAALECGRLRLGAAKSRGLGRVALRGAHITRLALNNPNAVLDALAVKSKENPRQGARLDGVDCAANIRPLAPADPFQSLTVRISWRAVSPVMSRASIEGALVDMLPLTTAYGDGLAPVLYGSGVKGVLRGHAERILRTILGAPHVEGEVLAPIDWLFGRINENDENNPYQNGVADPKTGEKLPEGETTAPGLGALSTQDVILTDHALTHGQWAALLGDDTSHDEVADHDDKERLAAQSAQFRRRGFWKDFSPRAHVAIDRWHGGAAEGLLYSRLEPPPDLEDAAVRDIMLEVNLARLPEGIVRDRALGLLFLTLRDFAKGVLPLGFGGGRGLGAVAVESVAFEGGPWNDVDLIPEQFDDDDSLEFLNDCAAAWDVYMKEIKTHG